MPQFKTWNGPMPTTAAQQNVATGTSIKTMLQVATPATRTIQLIAWGFSMAVGSTGTVELLQTDVAATVTAHIASGVQNQDPNGSASLMTLGTAATGYTASAEGSITATRVFDAQVFTGSGSSTNVAYEYQWMPDERPVIPISKFLRIRATMGTSTGFMGWVVWDE